jgi:hypothetical protein
LIWAKFKASKLKFFKLPLLEMKRSFFCILHTPKTWNWTWRHSQGIYVTKEDEHKQKVAWKHTQLSFHPLFPLSLDFDLSKITNFKWNNQTSTNFHQK